MSEADTVDRLEDAAEKAGRLARKVIDGHPSLSETPDAVMRAVRDEPVKASLIALGVGLILGLMINRK